MSREYEREFDRVGQRLEKIEKRFEEIGSDIANLRNRLDKVQSRVEGSGRSEKSYSEDSPAYVEVIRRGFPLTSSARSQTTFTSACLS